METPDPSPSSNSGWTLADTHHLLEVAVKTRLSSGNDLTLMRKALEPHLFAIRDRFVERWIEMLEARRTNTGHVTDGRFHHVYVPLFQRYVALLNDMANQPWKEKSQEDQRGIQTSLELWFQEVLDSPLVTIISCEAMTYANHHDGTTATAGQHSDQKQSWERLHRFLDRLVNNLTLDDDYRMALLWLERQECRRTGRRFYLGLNQGELAPIHSHVLKIDGKTTIINEQLKADDAITARLLMNMLSIPSSGDALLAFNECSLPEYQILRDRIHSENISLNHDRGLIAYTEAWAEYGVCRVSAHRDPGIHVQEGRVWVGHASPDVSKSDLQASGWIGHVTTDSWWVTLVDRQHFCELLRVVSPDPTTLEERFDAWTQGHDVVTVQIKRPSHETSWFFLATSGSEMNDERTFWRSLAPASLEQQSVWLTRDPRELERTIMPSSQPSTPKPWRR